MINKITTCVLFAILQVIAAPLYGQMVTVKDKPSFYLGQRSTLSLSLGIQPAFDPMGPKDYSVENSEKYINIFVHVKPELTYTYALSNKVALFARAAKFNTSRLVSDYESFTIQEDNGYDYSFYKETVAPKMRGSSVGLGLSFFKTRKAALAPIGKHFSVCFMRHNYNMSYEDNSFLVSEDYNSVTKKLDISDRESSFNYYSLEVGFGTNQLISNNLYYHLGFSTIFTTRYVTRALGDKNAKDDIDRNLFANNIASLSYRDIAVFRLGLGYVLF
jgi:hypothetical protein